MRVARRFPVPFLAGVAVLSSALAQAPPLNAQAEGTVVGTVVDDTSGEALLGATVSLPSEGLLDVTDEDGTFALPNVRAGQLTVRVERFGYATIVESVDVLPGEVELFQFRITRMEVALEGLLVRARRGKDGAEGPSVAEIDRGNRGDRFLRTALDLLKEQVPGVQVQRRGRYDRGGGRAILIRGSSSLLNDDPAIYLDGVRLGSGGSSSGIVYALEQIPAEQVQRIRVLRGPSAAAQYADAASGIILIETR